MRAVPTPTSIVLATAVLACAPGGEETPPSGLQQRAQVAAQAPAAPAKAEPAPPADGAGLVKTAPPPADAERVELRLALDDPTTYRIQTFGKVQLPLVKGATMFVRESRVDVDDCTGTGPTRRCRLAHRWTNFEAQPPGGRFIAADYDKIKDFETQHAMTATGRREGATQVAGPGTRPELGRALEDFHALLCLRFPDEPVAKGAKWKDTCRTFSRGQVSTREVVWELSEIGDDPEHGKRAELTVIGKYREPDAEGTIQGALYFYVDLGQPRSYRERITVVIDEKNGLESVTDLSYMIAKAAPGKPDTWVETTGRPLEGKALSSAPTDPEAAGGAKDEPQKSAEPARPDE